MAPATPLGPISPAKAAAAVVLLKWATAFYAAQGIRVQRQMTDNGAACLSVVDAVACRPLQIKRIRTRVYAHQPTAKPKRHQDSAWGLAFRAITASQGIAQLLCPATVRQS